MSVDLTENPLTKCHGRPWLGHHDDIIHKAVVFKTAQTGAATFSTPGLQHWDPCLHHGHNEKVLDFPIFLIFAWAELLLRALSWTPLLTLTLILFPVVLSSHLHIEGEQCRCLRHRIEDIIPLEGGLHGRLRLFAGFVQCLHGDSEIQCFHSYQIT